jgi:hypothetical protein
MSVEIELIDHVGSSRSGELVSHNQYIVKADGIHIGYMGKEPGSWLAMIVWVDEETKAAIVEAIAAKAGTAPNGVSMIPDPDLEEPDEESDEETEEELDYENEAF